MSVSAQKEQQYQLLNKYVEIFNKFLYNEDSLHFKRMKALLAAFCSICVSVGHDLSMPAAFAQLAIMINQHGISVSLETEDDILDFLKTAKHYLFSIVMANIFFENYREPDDDEENGIDCHCIVKAWDIAEVMRKKLREEDISNANYPFIASFLRNENYGKRSMKDVFMDTYEVSCGYLNEHENSDQKGCCRLFDRINANRDWFANFEIIQNLE